MTDSGFGRGPIPGRPGGTAQQQDDNQAPPPPVRPQALLEIANGPALGRSHRLERERTLIGRNDPPAVIVDIDLTDAELGQTPVISRRHAELVWIEDGLFIQDLGSTNGTLLNGSEITRRSGQAPPPASPLRDGDRIHLANIEMVLRLSQPEG
ncbi:MAG: FHA domain-containing protein [bacterium]